MSIRKRVAEISKGIIKGALEAENLEDIEKCLRDGDQIYLDFKKAVYNFELKTTNGTINGLKNLGNAIQIISSEFKSCKTDLKKLSQLANFFKSPSSFAFHLGKDLMVNGVDIMKHISDAVI